MLLDLLQTIPTAPLLKLQPGEQYRQAAHLVLLQASCLWGWGGRWSVLQMRMGFFSAVPVGTLSAAQRALQRGIRAVCDLAAAPPYTLQGCLEPAGGGEELAAPAVLPLITSHRFSFAVARAMQEQRPGWRAGSTGATVLVCTGS